MAERSRTVQDAFGRNVEGRDVDISESTERFSELRLEDGTILRIKPSVLRLLAWLNSGILKGIRFMSSGAKI